MIRFCSIASGSSGNAGLIEADGLSSGTAPVRLLIDAGISAKRILDFLKEQDLAPETLSGILLTHEHADHCAGLCQLLRKYPLPVYTSAGTFEALLQSPLGPRLPKGCFHLIQAGESLDLGGLFLEALPIPHDAAQPLSFLLEDADGTRFAWITDLGEVEDSLPGILEGLNGLALEANHDRRMLELGPYPYPLKVRIASAYGHLSNDAAGQLLARIMHTGLQSVLLVHLSQENNYPPLARLTVENALTRLGLEENDLPRILTAPARSASEWLSCRHTPTDGSKE